MRPRPHVTLSRAVVLEGPQAALLGTPLLAAGEAEIRRIDPQTDLAQKLLDVVDRPLSCFIPIANTLSPGAPAYTLSSAKIVLQLAQDLNRPLSWVHVRSGGPGADPENVRRGG